MGSHSFIPGFEEQLVNHLAGDEVDVKTTFPTNYHAKDLAGKEVIFKCKIHEVKTKSNPEFNDEFATHIGYKSKEELLKAIEDNLKANHESDAKNSYLEKLLHHIVSTSSIELTHDQIEKGKKQIIEYYNSTLSHYGLTIDTYLQTIGKSHSEFDAMIIKEAENTATTELLAKYIGEKENLLPTDDEINYRVQMYKVAYHIPDDKIDEFLAIQKEEIATEVLKEKVAKFLLENND